MIPVLLVSHDVGFLISFEDFVSNSPDFSHKIRNRQSSSVDDVKKWLNLMSFGIVIFDETLEKPEITSLLLECWSASSPPICAYFSKKPPNLEMKSLFVLGVEDCSGEDNYSKLNLLIDKIPKVINNLSLQHNAILVLEDLDSPRDIICALVQSLGFSEVIGASSADNALDILLADPFRFFCIISDINMPIKSGFTFVKELRQIMSLSYLPVVILTSDPSEYNLFEALKCGVTGFLAKPPKKNLLKAELDKARRIVALGRDPQVGSSSEIRMLESIFKEKRR